MSKVEGDSMETNERFSESNTAFNALSRDLGENWQTRFRTRRLSLVTEGKGGPRGEDLRPEEALFHYAYAEGFERVNILTAEWGSGKSNRGALRWASDVDLPEEVLAARCDDPIVLSRRVKEMAAHCGAGLTGITPLDPRWVYADVQRNHCSPETPQRTPIRFTDEEEPWEDEEALHLPRSIRYAVVFAVPMDRQMISTAPSLLAEGATSLGYSHAATVALSVATYVRSLGYQAIPSLNGTALNIPLAISAGLGEGGRNGLLITREYGACVRLSKVITDMPLIPDRPVDLGIRAYCEACSVCARACPVQAISHGAPAREANNECNRNGVKKWHIDAKKCLRYWVASGTSCSVCIARCPFTRENR